MRFIGDVHGKWNEYKKILTCNSSIQVGDFGIGFPLGGGNISTQPDFIKNTDHRFIRGNHDSLKVCESCPNWIEDGYYIKFKNSKILLIGGARSIDQQYRTLGIDWWDDEECSYNQFDLLIEKYLLIRPDIMVTHDLPWSRIPFLVPHLSDLYPSRTQMALDTMLQNHKPSIWICGHWHISVDKEIEGTRFKILNELEYFDLDIT